MPVLLRFLFFPYSLLVGISFPVFSLIPSAEFTINEKQVSHSEWWTSGAGPLSTIIGILLLISAIGFFLKKRFARITFLAPWLILLIVALVQGYEKLTIVGVFLLGIWMSLLIWYFFFKKSVQDYFEKSGGPDWNIRFRLQSLFPEIINPRPSEGAFLLSVEYGRFGYVSFLEQSRQGGEQWYKELFYSLSVLRWWPR